MQQDARPSFWTRELQRGMGGFLMAPLILLVMPSMLVPLLPGRVPLVLLLSFAASALSYLLCSRRWLFRRSRDPLEVGGWAALLGWLLLTSLITGLVSMAWR